MGTYLKNALIEATLRATNYTAVTPIYLALYTADPVLIGGEIVGGSYAREIITFIAPTAGVTSNTALVIFTTATANWGVITHFAIRDALTGGNLIYYGALATPRTILTGDTMTVPIGNIEVTLT